MSNSSKPIIRWTIGEKSTYESIECLHESIETFKKLYGSIFDYFLCHNNFDTSQIKCDIELINQHDHVNSLKFPPSKCSWKLYPPRIRPESHEIFIDNDLLIYKKMPIIERFLESNKLIFCTEAIARCFGNYDHLIPEGVKINVGFFGIPPHYDLGKKLNETIIGKWENYFDDQGILSTIFMKEEDDFEIIPLTDIQISAGRLERGRYGIHFVGLNTDNIDHWIDYKLIVDWW